MNQEKIGKFIAEKRKTKKLTQSELAEQLGVSDRSISNWENGKNMPDLSLFKPICSILDITINELLSGKNLNELDYQEKFEENIVNTIAYSTKKINKYRDFISLTLIIFGLFISLSAIMIFPSESSWGSIYSVFGIMIFIMGLTKIINISKWYKKILFIILIFTLTMGILLFTDYFNVKTHHEAPMFRIRTTTTGDVIYYDTLFYDVYRCHFDKENESWTIKKNNNPTINELLNYCS